MKCVALLAALLGVAHAACPNKCSGHGTCSLYDTCVCDSEDRTYYYGHIYDTTKGYDRIADSAESVQGTIFANLRSTVLSSLVHDYSSTEMAASGATDSDPGVEARRRQLSKTAFTQAAWTGPDCSQRTCGRSVSWIKAHKEQPHLHADFAECGDRGVCNGSTGECECYEGYEGKACQRTTCPDDCSGHGICRSNVELSQDAEETMRKDYLRAWDSGSHFGCKCEVGYRGENCGERECPSGSDPNGSKGNGQGRDCSGRGLCDYATGECQCFKGYSGIDCGTLASSYIE